MSEKDRLKWNRKYEEQSELLKSRAPCRLVEEFYSYAVGSTALDLASGAGRNTIFLAQKGFCVDAVDISWVALEALKGRVESKYVNIIEADLDHFTPPYGRYDLVVMTNFLDRSLMKRVADSLKPEALFIVETYMEHENNEKPDSNPNYLLKEGELKDFFGYSFEVLEYREFWNDTDELYGMRKQGTVVRKKSL